MAISKGKQSKSDTNKVQRARVEFLHRAAKYLHGQAPNPKADGAANAEQGHEIIPKSDTAHGETNGTNETSVIGRLTPVSNQRSTRVLTGQMRAISRKTLVRISQVAKRAICKRCNAVLETPDDYSEVMENESNGGKKPWADVRVVRCKACGTTKRFPVGAKRQLRKTARESKRADEAPGDASTTTS